MGTDPHEGVGCIIISIGIQRPVQHRRVLGVGDLRRTQQETLADPHLACRPLIGVAKIIMLIIIALDERAGRDVHTMRNLELLHILHPHRDRLSRVSLAVRNPYLHHVDILVIGIGQNFVLEQPLGSVAQEIEVRSRRLEGKHAGIGVDREQPPVNAAI